MSDIGIIGSRDLVEIFGLLDVTVYAAENVTEAKIILEDIIANGGPKVVFVLESLVLHLTEEMRRAEGLDYTTVVPLPDHRLEVSFLDNQIRRLSKEAIGMEI